ncbi:MAG: SUMF1/EgtB/PvdO family nonheme iron enzyme [Bryobacterales bacterium]|nr:SUMF1/EgtB/PvdO family nonheme iron enzyme [Bryobacterales bacterium]
MAHIVKIFVASPGDVEAERNHVSDVAAALNRNMADERGTRFQVVGWRTDVRARLHEGGPQGAIDEDLRIPECDIVVGIFWKRFGQPLAEMGGETGTQHEIRSAVAAWRATKKPEVVVCFNRAPFAPDGVADLEQMMRVMQFRDEIPGLWMEYKGADEFREKIRDWLEKYLREHYPVVQAQKGPMVAGDPERYIRALKEENSYFDVQGLKFGDSKAYRFPIDEYYIPLTTVARGAVEMRGVSLSLFDALRTHRRLMVVGDPGSGKSTFLRRAAYQACAEYSQGGPLPLKIEASVLAEFILRKRKEKSGPADAASPDWIPVFAGAQCEEKNQALSEDYFRAALKSGRCLVLIDGMDETPDELQRQRLARLLQEAARAYDGCRFVLTSRPEGKHSIDGFEEAAISDLEPDAIRAFLAKLARLLYSTDEVLERKFLDELERAVGGRREIRKLTRNPVMLTALVVLQHNNVRLPEKRADLYGAILGWLSKQRAKPDRLPAEVCLLRLRELALQMQNHEGGRRNQVTMPWAGDKLARSFGGRREEAERFLRAEQLDSGIVVSRGNEIAFWHLTFQEYLAAMEITGWKDEDLHELLLGNGAKIYQPEWRETALLCAALLYNVGPPKVEALVKKVLDGMGNHPTLADRARCVGLIGSLLPDLIGYQVEDARYAESLRLVMDIFDKEKSQSVPFDDKLKAAEALGLAGDPRLGKLEWVTIPETRNYWIGAQSRDPRGRNYDQNAFGDEALRQVTLPAFQIGRFPVTVAQYQAFVEEGTALDREPYRWEEQLEHSNWPVVDVTWHQATAYCAWAGGRLPTEEEWERAARGPDCTRYPWGNSDINPSRANYAGSSVGHPTPVGLYPGGASEEGVCDMIGNVLEWTASEWSKASGLYVWRGGCFCFGPSSARSAYRYVNLPSGRYDYLGFRIARNL